MIRQDQNKADVYSIASSPPTLRQVSASLNSRHISRGNSRVTMSSIRSKGTNHSGIVARRPASYKRNVSFNHGKKRSTSGRESRLRTQERKIQSQSLQERFIEDGERLEQRAASSPPIIARQENVTADVGPHPRSRKSPHETSKGIEDIETRRSGLNWTEDVRKISTELNKLCDTAFNRISLSSSTPTSFTSATINRNSNRTCQSPATSFSIYDDSLPVFDEQSTVQRRAVGVPDRPLPPMPPTPPNKNAQEYDQIVSLTHRELAKTKELLQKRNRASYMEPGYLDDVIAHLDRLMQPSALRVREDQRRAISSPNPNTGISRKDTFDQILEKGNIGFRSASEPSKQENNSPQKSSIRLVENIPQGDKAISPVKPLTIRKKNSIRQSPPVSPHKQHSKSQKGSSANEKTWFHVQEHGYNTGPSLIDKSLEPIVENDDFDPTDRNVKESLKIIPKKRSWFRRNHQLAQKGSRDTDVGPPPAKNSRLLSDCQNIGHTGDGKRESNTSEETLNSEAPRHKKGRFFKNIFTTGKARDKDEAKFRRIARGDYEVNDEESESEASFPRQSVKDSNGNAKLNGKASESDQAIYHKIALGNGPLKPTISKPNFIRPAQHQNWLARFLGIKPTVHTCYFQVSKIRARREIASLFREWRKYGMRDVVVDKAMGVICARVDAKNCKLCPLPSPFPFPFPSTDPNFLRLGSFSPPIVYDLRPCFPILVTHDRIALQRLTSFVLHSTSHPAPLPLS